MTDPVAVVQRQLDAYNARDLDAFLACFHDDAAMYRLPQQAPALAGRSAIATFYREHRFERPGLHAELLARIATGDTVVDHERVHGLDAAPVEMIAVYQVRDGAIATVWFFAP